MPTEFVMAHAVPEQPLGPGVRLCRCEACRLALEACARRDPRHTLLVRTSFDRILVTAKYAAEVWDGEGWLDTLLYQPGDWIRDVSSATAGELPTPARWWSRCLAAQVGVPRALRVHAPKRRPHPSLQRVA